MGEERPLVKNVKVHFKLKKNFNVEWKSAKRFSNYIVLRLEDVVYTVFEKSGHVNVTGIKAFSGIKESVERFLNQFDLDFHPSSIKIDNVTCCGRLDRKNISFLDIKRDVKGLSITIRPHFFPSMLIRRKSGQQNLPTMIVFKNGKYIIVGAKTRKDIDSSFLALLRILNNTYNGELKD